jgi:hypothetical protein
LYPLSYRRRYEEEILLAATDMLSEAPSRKAKLAVRIRLATDLPINIGKQQLIVLGERGFTQAPSYVKYNGYVAALLLLPFFLALIANAAAKLFVGHTLYHSLLWRAPYVGLWVLYFPMVALLLTAGSYAMYITRHCVDNKISLTERFLDIRRLWPVLLTGIVAYALLFIVFFHDSGQCWMRSPWHAATHMKQSLECTETNRASFKAIFEHSL